MTPGQNTVAAWLELQDQLAALSGATPCRRPTAAHRWISDDLEDQATAANDCEPCPALTTCRQYALTAREPSGVWGATTPADRRQLHRTRESA